MCPTHNQITLTLAYNSYKYAISTCHRDKFRRLQFYGTFANDYKRVHTTSRYMWTDYRRVNMSFIT